MKHIPFIFSVFLAISPASGQEMKQLVILHTNDLHSHLNGFAPEYNYSPLSINDDKTTGGFSRIAGLIAEERKEHGDKLLVLDVGDFLMGTFYHFFEEETGFQLNLMKSMGYDAVSIGNHEFDFGPSMLANMIKNAQKKGSPPVILSNIEFNEEEEGDDLLEQVYRENGIHPFLVLRRNGLTIGLFALMGENAADVAPRARPVTFADRLKTASAIAGRLKKEEKADVVICLSHSGITLDKNGNWTGEDVKLASHVPAIDLIISGHTHTLLPRPLVVNNIPIIQAGANGGHVGKIVLTVTRGKLSVDSYRMIPIDDRIQGDPHIHAMITAQKELISTRILGPLDVSFDEPVAELAYSLPWKPDSILEESTLGPLLADAIHSYVNRQPGLHADIAMVAAGMIRDSLVAGKQTVADLFRVVSLGKGDDKVPGYPLSMVYVNGKELKSIIEILLVAYKSNTDNYFYYSGIRIHIAPWKGLLRKVRKIELADENESYSTIDFSKKNTRLYSLVTNSYILEFIGILKKMSFGLVNVVPKDKDGNPLHSMKQAVVDIDTGTPGIQEGKEWIALLNYVRGFNDVNGNQIPDLPATYNTFVPRVIALKKE